MSRKKKTGQSAPPLPPGEFYSQYDVPKDSELRGVWCRTHIRWFSTNDAIRNHRQPDCEIKNLSTGEPYATDRPIQ